MKVLLVDDNAIILRLLDKTFSKMGYETIAAVDGMQARDFFMEEQPQLAIVDLMLPFVSGLELIELIRATETSYTKIIVLSKMGMQDTIQHAFELGVDDYLRKPFMPSELISRVRRLDRYAIQSQQFIQS